MWVMMNAAYPTPDTEETRAGSAAHELGAAKIEARAHGRAPDSGVPAVGAIAGNGEVVTEEMAEAAEIYAADVHATMQRTGSFRPLVEHRIHARRVHDHCWGTMDCALWAPGGRALYLWEFKYGHLPVDVFECLQLVAYFQGLFEEAGLTGLDDQNLTVVFTVVQPRVYSRGGPVQRWRVRASELRPLVNQLANAAGEALGPQPTARPGPHCEFCPGRHACEAHQRAGFRSMAIASQSLPFDMGPEAVGLELRKLREARQLIEGRISGLEEQAAAMIRSGKRVPFNRMEQGYGRERWKAPPEEVFALGDMYGVELRKPREPLTPGQARKAGLPPELVATYAEKPRGALKLVEDAGKKARWIFASKPEDFLL